jgi:hypothetical protein
VKRNNCKKQEDAGQVNGTIRTSRNNYENGAVAGCWGGQGDERTGQGWTGETKNMTFVYSGAMGGGAGTRGRQGRVTNNKGVVK